MELSNGSSGLTKKQLREVKRNLKQTGNQQKRSREKAALRDLVDGNLEAIPDFRIDNPSHYMNGLDHVDREHLGEPKVDNIPQSQWIDSPWRKELD